MIISEIKHKFKEEFLCREEWEMKQFGMITRGSYLFIENFPCEIHFNESLQMKVSKDVIHRIYELYRMNIESPEQKLKFRQEFKEFILKSKGGEYREYNDDIANSFQHYIDDVDSIERASDEELAIIKNGLLILHINIH